MTVQLVAYSSSIDSATLTPLTPVQDDTITIDGNQILVPPEMPNLVGIYGLGADITQLQVSAPSLRNTTLIDVSPLDQSAEPEEPAALHAFANNPRVLVPSEGLQVLAAEDGAGATQVTSFLWLMDSIEPIAPGPIEQVRFTATITTIAELWGSGDITLTQTLRAGRYQIVGFRVEATTLKAARLIIPGQSARPGVLGFDETNDTEPSVFRNGGWGALGEFEHTGPPRLEVLSVGVDTTQIGHLDIIRL